MLDFLQQFDIEDSEIMTIGLLLESEQEVAAVSISKQLCSHEQCSFILDPSQNPPRVRLYEAIFPVSEESAVLSLVEKLADSMIPFSMKWGSQEITGHFVAQWGESNEILDLFHDAVLEKLSPLRHGFFKQKYLPSLEKLSNQERNSIRRWGSPWAHPYRPHMILAKSVTTFKSIPNECEWLYKKCTFSGLIVGSRTTKVLESVRKYSFSTVSQTDREAFISNQS